MIELVVHPQIHIYSYRLCVYHLFLGKYLPRRNAESYCFHSRNMLRELFPRFSGHVQSNKLLNLEWIFLKYPNIRGVKTTL